MKLGIVGHEAAKFDIAAEEMARFEIRRLLSDPSVTEVCSGECPLGGIDIWAREQSIDFGIPFTPFPPAASNWEFGFKPRNLQIAGWSDKVVCIVVSKLPPTYHGRRFSDCYHCAKYVKRPKPHIKSGGCWTAWRCPQREWIII